MKTILSLWILVLLAFTGCKQDDKKELIIGKWQGVSWKVNGNESGRDHTAVSFEFKADDTYSASFGSQSENGIYRLSGDKLYTTGENKAEKMVELSTLTTDTIVMKMNRTGDSEELTLAKIR